MGKVIPCHLNEVTLLLKHSTTEYHFDRNSLVPSEYFHSTNCKMLPGHKQCERVISFEEFDSTLAWYRLARGTKSAGECTKIYLAKFEGTCDDLEQKTGEWMPIKDLSKSVVSYNVTSDNYC